MNTVDARGYDCPEPVIMAQNELKKEDEAIVLVDNRAALENIKRFCNNKGYNVEVEESQDDFTLTITKKDK